MYRELDLIQEHEDSLIVEEGIGPLVVMENTLVEKVHYIVYMDCHREIVKSRFRFSSVNKLSPLQILKMREVDGKEEFLAKYKGRAYIHCEWKTLEGLEETVSFFLLLLKNL